MAIGLFRRSLGALVLSAFASAAIFAVIAVVVMDRLYGEANAYALGESAKTLAAALPDQALSDTALRGPESRSTADWIAAAGAASAFRLTLIRPDGVVVADSRVQPATMENHATRPEVRAALEGGMGVSRRLSHTLLARLIYAAVPVYRAGDLRAVLRVSLAVPGLYARLGSARVFLAAGAVVIAAAAALAAALFSRTLSRPLSALTETAKAYGSGELSRRSLPRPIESKDPEEIQLLGATFDAMADELSRRIDQAKSQGRELEAILNAMAESVFALDGALRLRLANPAAAALFGLPPDAAGKTLLDATRSSDLCAVAAACLESRRPEEAVIQAFLPGERWFKVLAAPLQGGERAEGVVLVLNDITELRRLERIRRDFVANVSHELRTPVQLIKGFAEVLGAEVLDAEALDAEQARRFISIIERNAARMENLITDLLSLASLEREGGLSLERETLAIAPIIEAAAETLRPKAEAKRMEIKVSCPTDLVADVNPGLLEQALVNLVDNAVKYSPENKTVDVDARAEREELVLEVRDRGMGIPAKDLPRLFERFYRVDKARSRDLGGTGLGLAIVRHIALAHGGGATVQSWEGEGSTFTLRLPLVGLRPEDPMRV